jgi:hypothetical protein
MNLTIKGGFQVKLGAVGQGDAKDLVTSSAVKDLLSQVSSRPEFREAQSKLEFRLLERDGQAYLQLKERNWASKFKSALGIGSEARSEQRLAAMQAINSRYGLGLNKLRDQDSAGLAQARAFVNDKAVRLANLHQTQEARQAWLGAGDERTHDQVLDMIGAVHQSAADGEVQGSPHALAGLFDKKIHGTLTRSNVSVDNGVLKVGGRYQGKDAGENLETVVKFVEDQSGIGRADARFKPLLRNLMRNDHFLFAAKTNDALSMALTAKFGAGAMSLDMSGQNQISFDPKNQNFKISQSCEGTVLLGPAFESNPGAFKSAQRIRSEQSFELNIAALTSESLNVTASVQNLQHRDSYT